MTPKVGDIYDGTVVMVRPHYAILLFEEGWTGLLHISEVSHSYIRNFEAYVNVGNIYNVKVIAVDEEKGNVRVSIKAMNSQDKKKASSHRKIDPSEIDFSSLKKQLDSWIEMENRKEI